MKLSTSRVVAFLIPVFAALDAVGTAWLGKHFPGLPKPTTSELLALEVAGATAGLTAGIKWLHGLSVWENAVRDTEHFTQLLTPVAKDVNLADPGLTAAVVKDAEAEVPKVLADAGAPAGAWPVVEQAVAAAEATPPAAPVA